MSSWTNLCPPFVSALICTPWNTKKSLGLRFLDEIAFPFGVVGPVLFCQGCHCRIFCACFNRLSDVHRGMALSPLDKSKLFSHQPFDTRSRPSSTGRTQQFQVGNLHKWASLVRSARCNERDRRSRVAALCHRVMTPGWHPGVVDVVYGCFVNSSFYRDESLDHSFLSKVAAVRWVLAAFV